MSDQTAQLKEILLEKSVRTGEFTLASGKTSDLYIDCRVTAMDSIGAGLVGTVGWTAVRERIQAEGLDIQCWCCLAEIVRHESQRRAHQQ